MKRLKEKRKERRLRRQLRHSYVESRGCFFCNLLFLRPRRRNGKTLDTRPLSEIMGWNDDFEFPQREWWQQSLLDSI